MNNPWYLHVRKDDMQICKVTPVLEPDEDTHIIQVDSELGISFVNGPHLMNLYVVYYDGTVCHLIKKEKSKDVVAPFYYSPVLIDKEVENADIAIDIKPNLWTFSLRKEMRSYAMTIYGQVDRSKQLVQFYVSAKNDPNKLLGVLHVDMMELISKGEVTFDYDFDPEKVSVFTRKIFDSYSLTK